MDLGNFSVSLSVKDLAASRAFYAALGFVEVAGEAGQGWLILRNGAAVVGLFEGMFAGNRLTFNPGWAPDGSPLTAFTDVREIEARARAAGLTVDEGTDPKGEGPASITLVDPDGNRLLIDQHVPRPGTGA